MILAMKQLFVLEGDGNEFIADESNNECDGGNIDAAFRLHWKALFESHLVTLTLQHYGVCDGSQ